MSSIRFWRIGFFITLKFYICVNVAYCSNTNRDDKKLCYPLDVKIAVGVSITGGNNSTRTATLNSELDKRYTRFRVRINGKGAYGEASYSNGPWIESTHNWRINTRVDWFTTSQLHSFLFTEAGLQSNQYRGYWLKNSLQGGYGIKLFGGIRNIDVSLPLGIDYARDILVVDNGQRSENFAAVLKPEIVYKINAYIQYRKKSNIFMDLQDDENYRVDSENIIDLHFTNTFALRISYMISHYNKPRLIREVDQAGKQTDERVPAKPTDHLFSTSMMISF